MILQSTDGTQKIDFCIDEKYKNIGINCSGGADSSILLYMLVKYLTDTNRTDVNIKVLTCSNDLKGRWNGRVAANVIDFVIATTGTNLIDSHLTYYRDVQDVSHFKKIEDSLFAEKKIDLLVVGITANPKESNATVEDSTGALINISNTSLPDRNQDNSSDYVYTSEGSWYRPFINNDKKLVAGIYRHFDLEDTLLPITRSCEEIHAHKSNNYTEPCGTCWWCLERKWAFDKF